MTHWKRSLHTCIVTIALATSASAQTVLVSGLEFPSKAITIPNGNLLVTETGRTPNSGRVTIVTAGGESRTLVAGLPSGLSFPGLDADGTNGLHLAGRVLYVANGEGDTLRAGARAGTTVANPEGVSSPILTSIVKVTFDRDLDQYPSPFTLSRPNHFDLSLGNIVTLDDGAGRSAVFELVTKFSNTWPDANTIYRNSHPYGLSIHPDVPGTLFTADAGMNLIWQTNAATGRTKVLVQFPNVPNVGAVGPPTKEAVPNSVRACGDGLLVTLLSGGPFAAFNASVMTVNPATGEAHTFIAGLSMAIDVACPSQDPLYLVLEYMDLSATPPLGRVLRYASAVPIVLLDKITTPTNMALDESTGTVYIVSRSEGKIFSARYR